MTTRRSKASKKPMKGHIGSFRPVKPAVDRAVSVDVERRKPRIVWQGMDRREIATSVPTQVVEIVRPSKATSAAGQLPGMQKMQKASNSLGVPPNRLIWTNDNLVALRTLLDEIDPVTKNYRYRGQVDLVYIDPPFMVNNDFQADNSIDIEIDESEHVEAKKEPSLVEILAYKDTWREGLDSFLSMMRGRLNLLKTLISPTGSIYVHLDWHAVHYVKVLMDEIFGYENFQNEIIWKRASARAGSGGINRVHDTILSYSRSPKPFSSTIKVPYDPLYVRSHYGKQDEKGRYRLVPLNAPGESKGVTGDLWRGYQPPKGRHWSHEPGQLEEFVRLGLIQFPTKGKNPELKQYIEDSEGIEINSIWGDVAPINAQGLERLGYPTQKPVSLVDRIIQASCPPGGLVLDCFAGSGTTAEAAERSGRRWIVIDNAKYAIHLTRKRLINLHGQAKEDAELATSYVECSKCGGISTKQARSRVGRLVFDVKPFTIENMGVYQRAAHWQDFQTERSRYRDEMIKVFGGEVVNQSPLLHGKKGNFWVHVGPLDGPVSVSQVRAIAREASKTDCKTLTILSADFDTLSGSERETIERALNVTVYIRVIPMSAVEEVARRLKIENGESGLAPESMAVPAFYSPLSIKLRQTGQGRNVKVILERCDIDIESFLASQRPILKTITAKTTPAAKKKAQAEMSKWEQRQRELEKWLAKANSWQSFVDFWAIDWNYGRCLSENGKPIFETNWQSFRARRSKKEIEPLILTAENTYARPGSYQVAARVTDVFGNDGISCISVEVK